MSATTEYYEQPVAAGSKKRSLSTVIAVFATVALAVAAVSLWQVGSSLSKQACVEKAVGMYPAVSVSAFTGKSTGALKLSFVSERQKALSSCG